MRVAFGPTAFPSAGRTYLTYELYLTNFGTAPLILRRVEVFDADAMATEPIAAFEEGRLDTLLQRVGDPIVGDQMPVAGASKNSVDGRRGALGLEQCRRRRAEAFRKSAESYALSETGDADICAAAALHVTAALHRDSVVEVHRIEARCTIWLRRARSEQGLRLD
jgi:hypothetical protein